MDPGSPVLDAPVDWMDLFGRQHSMDLDALAVGSLPSLDDNGLAFAMQPSLRSSFPGPQDLVSAALRSQPGAAGRLDVDGGAIRSSVPTVPEPAAAQMVPPPAAQYSIKPMPARKSVACKPVVVVKQEPAVEQQQQAPPAAKKQQPKKQDVKLQQQKLKQQQLEELQAEADAAAFDSDSSEPTSAHAGGKRRRRIRNAKQQELNRLAQQRYRERRKQKYSSLQDTVEELSGRLGQLSTLEAANNELQQRNTQLEVVVKDQNTQLQVQKETITRQAQQLQSQAAQLSAQAKQLQTQVSVIQQQDKTLQELRSKLAAADSSSVNNAAAPGSPKPAGGADAEQLNDQIALAVRAVLTGVGSMACLGAPPAKDAASMQQIAQLPDALLQQIRTCCREVALHLKKTEVKEQPHAITVPCC